MKKQKDTLDVKSKLEGLMPSTPVPPLQQIVPVVSKKGYERTGFHINAWIPEDYEKPIKRYCVENDITIREFMIQAIDQKLNP